MFTLLHKPPQEVEGIWHLVRPGLERVCAKVDRGDYSPVKAFADIMRGHSALYLGYVDGIYKGFLILTASKFEYGPPLLIVSAMYSVLETREEWDVGYEIVKAEARKVGAQFIEFRTSRKGFEKIMPELGWQDIYTIWRREV